MEGEGSVWWGVKVKVKVRKWDRGDRVENNPTKGEKR